MTQIAGNGRNEYFDSLKCILITLVVIGHILDCYHDNRTLLAIDNVIYSFHMPLFIFISGYFCKDHADTRKKVRSTLLLLETLIVFQLLHCLMPLLHGDITPMQAIIYPEWSMWYLYSLIAWRIIAYITPKAITHNLTAVLSITIACSLLGGFIPLFSGELSVQRTLSFMPFFFLGHYCRVRQIDPTKYRIPKALAATIIIAAFAVMMVKNHDLSFVLWGKAPYHQPYHIYIVLRVIHLISATVMGLSVMSLVPPLSRPFLSIGSDTLFIYMYHTFIITAVLALLTAIGMTPSTITTLTAIPLTTATLITLRKSKTLHYILNPISNLIPTTALSK